MKRTITFLLLIASCQIAIGQISGDWHSSCYHNPFTDYSMKLAGNVKSWTMTSSNNKNRTITFDKNGKLISDSFKGTTQTFIPPDFMVYKLKIDLEKPSPLKKKEDSLSTYNNRMQLVERHAPNYHEKNYFDDSGKILIHQQTFTTTETRAWNSIHHAEPTYTYTVKTGTLAFFKYNDLGSLTEILYFNSNPDHNLRMVYSYDQNNNMIETKRYDSYNISTHNKPDDYLDVMMQSEVDTNFAIEKWNGILPTVTGVGAIPFIGVDELKKK